MFDPNVGVWLQEDPIDVEAGDVNPHRYSRNNPVNATDPTGLEPNLKVEPLKPPSLGIRGGVFWPIRWKLDKASEKGGYVLQEIEITWDITMIRQDGTSEIYRRIVSVKDGKELIEKKGDLPFLGKGKSGKWYEVWRVYPRNQNPSYIEPIERELPMCPDELKLKKSSQNK